MRYELGHKEGTRARILEAAARLFRAEGYGATGVARLMGESELTVGGFYAHFPSKEALLREVLALSFSRLRALLLAGLDEVSGEPFVREIARRYLSRLHRDQPGEGCAAPGLAAEVSRHGEETRGAFEEQLLGLLELFEPHMPPPPPGLGKRDHTLALAALLVGGMSLARAVRSRELSDRILLACRRFAAAPEVR